MQRRARGGYNGGTYAGTVDIDVLPFRLHAGFHVTGMWSGSLGVSFISADWWVRVLKLYGIIDIPYGHQ